MQGSFFVRVVLRDFHSGKKFPPLDVKMVLQHQVLVLQSHPFDDKRLFAGLCVRMVNVTCDSSSSFFYFFFFLPFSWLAVTHEIAYI